MEDILVFRLIELPWKVYCKIFRSLRWQYRYSLKGMEYTPEDSIIMTYTTMKISKAK